MCRASNSDVKWQTLVCSGSMVLCCPKCCAAGHRLRMPNKQHAWSLLQVCKWRRSVMAWTRLQEALDSTKWRSAGALLTKSFATARPTQASVCGIIPRHSDPSLAFAPVRATCTLQIHSTAAQDAGSDAASRSRRALQDQCKGHPLHQTDVLSHTACTCGIHTAAS